MSPPSRCAPLPEPRNNYLDNQQIDVYATNRKGRAKIATPGDNDRTVPFELLDFLPDLGQDQALCFWIDRALNINDDVLAELFEKLPDGVASAGAQKFARALTCFTRTKLQQLREEIS